MSEKKSFRIKVATYFSKDGQHFRIQKWEPALAEGWEDSRAGERIITFDLDEENSTWVAQHPTDTRARISAIDEPATLIDLLNNHGLNQRATQIRIG